MSTCTIVVPTRDRPGLVRDAVDSALTQTDRAVEVVVVDDGSRDPLDLPGDARLRVLRHLRPRGVSAARNLGIAAATTSHVAFLDDDDRLRPRFLEASWQLLAYVDAPGPTASLTAVAVVDRDGREREVRRPPRSRPRGQRFSLEPIEEDRSYFSKQTLVAPRDALLAIDGFDERLRSRVVTELFWRLNAVCSLVGGDEVTYELRDHDGPRISTDPRLREASFRQLEQLHAELLAAHPEGHARLLAEHARTSWAAGNRIDALRAVARHVRVAPGRTRWALLDALRRR